MNVSVAQKNFIMQKKCTLKVEISNWCMILKNWPKNEEKDEQTEYNKQKHIIIL